jgi:hypothetical protein
MQANVRTNGKVCINVDQWNADNFSADLFVDYLMAL